ncbi:MAG TPA: hypothetical protein VK253_00060 [Candidatus Binatia bacterium]|nr:hypothetical protein [Candidatus Binatia bacterium]
MSLASKLKTFKPFEVASLAFYSVTGIILLAFLFLTGFPPHIAFLGILSLITAYSFFAKRAWTTWLVAGLFIIITAFTLDTLFSVGFSNALVGLSMIGYAALTWIFTAYILLKK